MVECDDGEFRGIGGYQGQCEPDPAPRQSEAQRLAPPELAPYFYLLQSRAALRHRQDAAAADLL